MWMLAVPIVTSAALAVLLLGRPSPLFVDNSCEKEGESSYLCSFRRALSRLFPSKQLRRQAPFLWGGSEVEAAAAPPHESDLVVVLDLDECLVHVADGSSANGGSTPTDASGTEGVVLRFPSQTGHVDRKVFLRPGCENFLRACLSRYETHIFTAGDPDHARPILSELERHVGKRFAGCLYRDSCRKLNYMNHEFCFKDMAPFVNSTARGSTALFLGRRRNGGKTMKRIVLVDDDPTNFAYQPDNGIPVRSFTGQGDDSTLKKVEALLLELEKADDVRLILRERFLLGKAFAVAKQIHPSVLHSQWEHVYKCAQLVQL